MKKNKPDFHHSMGPELAPKIYEQFLELLKKEYDPNLVKGTVTNLFTFCSFASTMRKVFSDGKFGAYMKVNIENDGPVTLTLDSTTKDSV